MMQCARYILVTNSFLTEMGVRTGEYRASHRPTKRRGGRAQHDTALQSEIGIPYQVEKVAHTEATSVSNTLQLQPLSSCSR